MCGIASVQMRDALKPMVDAIDPAIRAEFWLRQDSAIGTPATGDATLPEHPITRPNAIAMDIAHAFGPVDDSAEDGGAEGNGAAGGDGLPPGDAESPPPSNGDDGSIEP